MRITISLFLLVLIVAPAALVLWSSSMLGATSSSQGLRTAAHFVPQDAAAPKQPPAAEPDTQRPDNAAASKDQPTVTTQKYSRSGYDITPYSADKVAELAKKLDPEAYRVTQKAGTEPAFCGTLLDNKKEGAYCCVVCGLPLFASAHKFNSGTGWPSFYTTFDREHVVGKEDNTHGMQRIEINCARCDAHLGHVFDDGPAPTGLRFCLNGAALKFYEKSEQLPPESSPIKTEVAYFAGGCFWGIEHYFQQAPGVISAESGYMQGTTDKPTYKDVCEQDDKPAAQRPEGFKGHAEVVKVVYDPAHITFRKLLQGFFEMHDPTQLNRQGPDYGTQYRSGVYTVGDAQAAETKAYVAELAAKALFNGRKIVTEIEPAKTYFPAETYHQDYLEKNPERGCHIGKPWWLSQESPAAAR
jgi:peptide methionine sulfoxide reductase msrA/msrB